MPVRPQVPFVVGLVVALTACAESPSSTPENLVEPDFAAHAVDSALLARILSEVAPAVPTPSNRRTLDDYFADLTETIPGFGGLYYVNDRLTVNLAGERSLQLSPGEVTALAEFLQIIRPGDVEGTLAAVASADARQVRFDFRTLLAWKRDVKQVLRGHEGAFGYDVDDRSNEVVVYAYPNTLTSQDLHSLLPDVPPEALRIVEDEPAAPSLRTRHTRVVGGMQIRYSDQNECTFTTGAEIYPSPAPGHYFGLVASHCSDVFAGSENGFVLQPFSIPGTFPASNAGNFGGEAYDPPLFTGGACDPGYACREADAAIVVAFEDRSTYQGRSVVSGLTYTDRRAFGYVKTPLMNETVAKVGRTSGHTSGTVTHVCYDEEKVDRPGVLMVCQYRATTIGEGGDSGAPVFIVSGGFVDIFVGVLWGVYGANGGPGPIIFSGGRETIGELEDHIGRQVCISIADSACP